jgi:hypothetical protein
MSRRVDDRTGLDQPLMFESRSWRARVRIEFSMSVSVWPACGASTQAPEASFLLLEHRHVQPVRAQARIQDVDGDLEALVGFSGLAYQSVTMTPP